MENEHRMLEEDWSIISSSDVEEGQSTPSSEGYGSRRSSDANADQVSSMATLKLPTIDSIAIAGVNGEGDDADASSDPVSGMDSDDSSSINSTPTDATNSVIVGKGPGSKISRIINFYESMKQGSSNIYENIARRTFLSDTSAVGSDLSQELPRGFMNRKSTDVVNFVENHLNALDDFISEKSEYSLYGVLCLSAIFVTACGLSFLLPLLVRSKPLTSYQKALRMWDNLLYEPAPRYGVHFFGAKTHRAFRLAKPLDHFISQIKTDSNALWESTLSDYQRLLHQWDQLIVWGKVSTEQMKNHCNQINWNQFKWAKFNLIKFNWTPLRERSVALVSRYDDEMRSLIEILKHEGQRSISRLNADAQQVFTLLKQNGRHAVGSIKSNVDAVSIMIYLKSRNVYNDLASW